MSTRELLEQSNYQAKRMQQDAKALVSKWEKTGLLEGINTSYEKDGMAILLENQAKQLLDETSRTGGQANSEEWAGVALPLVRRIFAEIAAKDFVSVQPMSLPSGLVFFLDFKYATAQPNFTIGSGKDSQADSVFGITGKAAKDVDPSGGLYGPGRFGYSINESTANFTTGSSLATTRVVTSSISEADYHFDSEFYNTYSASIAAGHVKKATILTSDLANFDKEGIRAFKIAGTNIDYFPQYTSLNSAETQLSFLISGSGYMVATCSFQTQPTAITRGDFEDTTGTLDIPEINMELRSETIVAKTRKLKAIWTPEFAQDVNAYHSIDAEAELTSMLSEYISQEIDLEIIDMLIRNAQTTERWSARVGRQYNGATGVMDDYGTVQAQASAYTQQQWFQTLGTKIQKVSNVIHQKTLRGGANFMVVSPQVATILESMNGFVVNTDTTDMRYAMGVSKVGQFNSRIQVYKNPYMLENQILMGYRGSQFLETGAVYAPYIPLIMTPLVYDPNTFTPRKGVMTRYAKKIVRPEFYGLIQIDSLGDI
jgi:hypothetical protein